MTPKALSAEDLAEVARAVVEGGPGMAVLSHLLAHISALEADNAEHVKCLRAIEANTSCDGTADVVAGHLSQPHPGAALLERHEKEVAGLRAFVDGFSTTAEGAVRHHETKGLGGQQVSYHDDFALIAPSGVRQLRWWARTGREVLGGTVSRLLVRAKNEGLERAVDVVASRKRTLMSIGIAPGVASVLDDIEVLLRARAARDGDGSTTTLDTMMEPEQ